MPTPFMHLQIAEDILASAKEESSNHLQEILEQEWPAFYLGSVAADYQTIRDIPREDTHFYDLPPAPDAQAYPTMLAQNPQLANASDLPLAQAVFVAAYHVHLMLDLLWFRQILIPYFVLAAEWGDFPKRHLVHNILLTYLDKLAFDSLPSGAATVLSQAQPDNWLPFAEDTDLVSWRDMLVAQLRPGATLKTVEIYASRLKMSPDEFDRKLQDPVWIEKEVFSNIPVSEIQDKLEAAIPHSINLITSYLRIKR